MQEAKQALDLMGRWEMIDVSDALELLSPVFESEEVGFYHDNYIKNLLHGIVYIRNATTGKEYLDGDDTLN